MVPLENVNNSAAVGNYVSLKVPFAAKLLLQQELVHARGLPVDSVVGAHYRSRLRVDEGGAERRKISIKLVVFADLYIGGVAGGFRAAVNSKMLGRRNHAVIFRIVSLHSRNKRHAHLCCEEWIFAVGFLAASPTRVTKNIDVGGPEIEALEDVAMSGAHRLRVLDAPLDTDVGGHLVNRSSIKCCGEPDRFGKFRGPVGCDAVQALTPPVVGRDPEPGN